MVQIVSERPSVRLLPTFQEPILNNILDYLYTWRIPEVEDEDVLLEIMKLSDYWDIPVLFEAMQIRIINLGLISVDTYNTCEALLVPEVKILTTINSI